MTRRSLELSVFKGNMLTFRNLRYENASVGPTASMNTMGNLHVFDLTAEDFRTLAQVAADAADQLEKGESAS